MLGGVIGSLNVGGVFWLSGWLDDTQHSTPWSVWSLVWGLSPAQAPRLPGEEPHEVAVCVVWVWSLECGRGRL